MSMKILVFGAGAVGSALGGMLARGGHEVTLVGRNPQMSRIASSGLKISGLWGDHHVQSLRAVTEIPPDFAPDWILLTTKSFDTGAAATALARAFPRDIPILHLQNGIGNADVLAKQVGWPRVISGMIIIGFQIPLAGRVVVTVIGDSIKIGRSDGTLDATVRDMARVFSEAAMPAEAVDNISMHLWGKVLYNAALNPLAAILGVSYGQLLQPQTWNVITKIMGEAYQVLQAQKQRLFWPIPEDYLKHLRDVQVPATFDHKPSMLSDLRHARLTEIESLNGALTALGRKHGIPTPVNDTLVALIHAFEENGEQGILHPSLQPE